VLLHRCFTEVSWFFSLGFERSQSKKTPLEKPRSKLANPVELSWGLAGVSTGVASVDGDLLIGIFWTGFTLTGLVFLQVRLYALAAFFLLLIVGGFYFSSAGPSSTPGDKPPRAGGHGKGGKAGRGGHRDAAMAGAGSVAAKAPVGIVPASSAAVPANLGAKPPVTAAVVSAPSPNRTSAGKGGPRKGKGKGKGGGDPTGAAISPP